MLTRSIKLLKRGVIFLTLLYCLIPSQHALGQDAGAEWRRLLVQSKEAYSQGKQDVAIQFSKEALKTARASFGERDVRTMTTAVGLSELYYENGRYDAATALLRNTCGTEAQLLGDEQVDTLRCNNDLATSLWAQGKYDEAEPLLRSTVSLEAKILGFENPATLTTMNTLATLLGDRGHFGQAELMYNSLLKLQMRKFDGRSPAVLRTNRSLATLLWMEGRYGEAERIVREILQIRTEQFGPQNPATLESGGDLAAILYSQQRYREAEALYRESLSGLRQTLGLKHPETLRVLNSLGEVLRTEQRYSEAEPLLHEAAELRKATLGELHPDTLTSMLNEAGVLFSEGHYKEAEPIFRDVVLSRTKVFGRYNPVTVEAANNLAVDLAKQGHRAEAEEVYGSVLDGLHDENGPVSPRRISVQLNHVINLVSLGRVSQASRMLGKAESELLIWMGGELYGTEAAAVRQQLVASQSSYQDVAIGLALQSGAPPETADLAATALLRFKALAVEEEAYLAHLARSDRDPHARSVAAEIGRLRAQLASLSERGDGAGANGPRQMKSLSEQLDRKELELGQASGAYHGELQVRRAKIEDVQRTIAGLSVGSALLDLRLYHPVDFKAGELSETPHWAGVLTGADGAIHVRDLGPVADTAAAAKALLRGSGPTAEDAARKLYEQLLTPFAAELAQVERLYIAPDGALYLIPFGLLRDPSGRVLLETKDVRLIQTGRDLLREAPDRPRQGLLAMGGIDFDHAPLGASSPTSFCAQVSSAPVPAAAQQVAQLTNTSVAMNRGEAAGGATLDEFAVEERRGFAYARQRVRETLRDGFGSLPASQVEVEEVARRYCTQRPGEAGAVEVDTGTEASKARLRGLVAPPRVLHLATHGFYRAPTEPADRPLVLSGIALAGANLTLHDGGEEGGGTEGILSALEALDLNLDGTELVVLSACDTAEGQIDYGEGVSGLVRALRTAGAREVLVTLRPVGDRAAAAFMNRFYGHWLGDTHGDAAAALRQTQLEYLDEERRRAKAQAVQAQENSNGGQSDRGGASPGKPSPVAPTEATPTWASFVLIGG